MGEWSGSRPTAADYVHDAARAAQQHSQNLERRVTALERQIREMYALVQWIKNRATLDTPTSDNPPNLPPGS